MFAGERAVGEINLPGASGDELMAYTWGPDGLAFQRNLSTGEVSYFHYGPQGETRYLTSSTGAIQNSYLFNAWGVPLSTTETVDSFHQYGGKYGYYTEGVTGVILAGARAYHPYLMRWVSRDPVLLDGGWNFFEYANSNPVRFVDPTGEEPTTAGLTGYLFEVLGTTGTQIGAGAASGAVAAGAVVGTGAGVVAAGLGVACIWDLDGCEAAYDGFCEANSVNVYSKGDKKRQKPGWIENPNRKKGADERQPTGEREKNVGHPKGEEHSKRPKGGFRPR